LSQLPLQNKLEKMAISTSSSMNDGFTPSPHAANSGQDIRRARTRRPIMFHTFSIGLRSGLLAGHCIEAIPTFSRYSDTILALCGLALLCWRMKLSPINGPMVPHIVSGYLLHKLCFWEKHANRYEP
jgi:hypothetical protein